MTEQPDLSKLKETPSQDFSGLVEQNESIKLIKNTRGYNWEIKILSLDVDRIEQLNDEMKKRFGEEPK